MSDPFPMQLLHKASEVFAGGPSGWAAAAVFESTAIILSKHARLAFLKENVSPETAATLFPEDGERLEWNEVKSLTVTVNGEEITLEALNTLMNESNRTVRAVGEAWARSIVVDERDEEDNPNPIREAILDPAHDYMKTAALFIGIGEGLRAFFEENDIPLSL